MTKRRTPETRGLPRLTTSRAEAKGQISRQIDKGKQLLAVAIGSQDDLDEARRRYKRWDDFNSTLLQSLFDSSEISDEYDQPVRLFVSLSSTLATHVKDSYHAVETKLARLESVVDQLVLYQEPAPPATGPSPATVRAARAAVSLRDYRELQPFLDAFRADHPEPKSCVFLMMKYRATPLHTRIAEAIRATCSTHGLEALRADDKRYSDDLLPNVRTYMHGCDSGIAVLERLTEDDFNPNVSLEVGYMMAQAKPVCLLKDKTLTSLQTDLLGRLYDAFDTQDPENTIPPVLEKWLKDKGLAP
jgi:hypothetical protein